MRTRSLPPGSTAISVSTSACSSSGRHCQAHDLRSDACARPLYSAPYLPCLVHYLSALYLPCWAHHLWPNRLVGAHFALTQDLGRIHRHRQRTVASYSTSTSTRLLQHHLIGVLSGPPLAGLPRATEPAERSTTCAHLLVVPNAIVFVNGISVHQPLLRR